MRIFLSCQQSKCQHPVPAYQFWETYFKNGIAEANHEWVEAEEVDWAEGLVYSEGESLNSWRSNAWSRTISDIKQKHQRQPIDLFLSYLFPKQVDKSAVGEIQALGIPCVNFFCDNVREFIRVPQEFYCFNLHWVPEFKAIKQYQQAKLNYIYAPMPVWVPPQQRTWEHPENYGISFIGSRDVQREALLAQALKLGASIEIRGAGWHQSQLTTPPQALPSQSLWNTVVNQIDFVKKNGLQGLVRKTQAFFVPRIPENTFNGYARKEFVTDTEYVNVTQQSKVLLGINRYPSYRYPFYKPDTYSRLRDLEAPMMGACYLTEWTEGLDRLYELGKEIEIYHTAEEMVEKIRELEANPEKRQLMRCQAQKRALTEHTIPQTIKKIIDFLQ